MEATHFRICVDVNVLFVFEVKVSSLQFAQEFLMSP